MATRPPPKKPRRYTNGRRLKTELDQSHDTAFAMAQDVLKNRLDDQDKVLKQIIANQEQRDRDRAEELRKKAESEHEGAKERKDFRRKIFLTIFSALVVAILGIVTTVVGLIVTPFVTAWVQTHIK